MSCDTTFTAVTFGVTPQLGGFSAPPPQQGFATGTTATPQLGGFGTSAATPQIGFGLGTATPQLGGLATNTAAVPQLGFGTGLGQGLTQVTSSATPVLSTGLSFGAQKTGEICALLMRGEGDLFTVKIFGCRRKVCTRCQLGSCEQLLLISLHIFYVSLLRLSKFYELSILWHMNKQQIVPMCKSYCNF